MRSVRNTINGDLDLFGALRFRGSANSLVDLLDRNDASENIGTGSKSDDASFAGYQGKKVVDLETDRVRVLWIERLCVPDLDNGTTTFSKLLPDTCISCHDVRWICKFDKIEVGADLRVHR